MRVSGTGKSSDVSKTGSGKASTESFAVAADRLAGMAGGGEVSSAPAVDEIAFGLWEAGNRGRSRRRALVERQRRTLDILGALQQSYLDDRIDPRLAEELVRRLKAASREAPDDELAAVCGEIEQVVSVQLAKLGRPGRAVVE